jgi:hypothetical protein
MNLSHIKHSSEDQAKVPARGKLVKVIAGRKVPHGITGLVFWAGIKNYDKYGRSCFNELRIGIESDGQRYFTAAKNVEVIDWHQYIISDAEAEAQARQLANRYC